MISDLERSIAKYKEEYAVLIAEVQAIKSDLASVEKKVGVKWLSSQFYTADSHCPIFLSDINVVPTVFVRRTKYCV